MDLEKLKRIIDTISLPRYVRFVAETGKRTCNACQRYDGRIFAESDTNKPHLPIHPNCRCRYELVQMTSKNIGFQTEKGEIAVTLKSLHRLSDEAAAELAEQITIARMENGVLEKEKLFLLFNGRYLMSSDGQLLLEAVAGKAVSRKSTDRTTATGAFSRTVSTGFDYSYERQGIRDKGGTPEGVYHILAKERRSAFTSPVTHILKEYGWGSFRWKLHPESDTDTRGREDFFLHGGEEFGSGGCIDLRHSVTIFKNYFEATKLAKIYICVKYQRACIKIVEEEVKTLRNLSFPY